MSDTVPAAPVPPSAHRALVSPSADFWLVGGASAVAFVLFNMVTAALGLDLQYKPRFLALLFLNLAFVVNYPHFAYSYQLFYKGFWSRVTGPETETFSRLRNVIAGIVAPLGMIAFFIAAYRAADIKYIEWANDAMVFSVGWHYVKQGYGVLITLSLYENVFYKTWEKRALWINAYIVWLYAWLRIPNYYLLPGEHGGYQVRAAPDWILHPFLIFACISSIIALAVLLKHWLWDDKGISCNAVTGYAAAVYMWMLMPFVNDVFYVLIIPLFHSLQYLPFVYKFKKSEFQRAGKPVNRRTLMPAFGFVLAGIVLGALFFRTLPYVLDRGFGLWDREKGPFFFMAAFFVFINIHHFFIDSAFWRRDNKDVQDNLFRA